MTAWKKVIEDVINHAAKGGKFMFKPRCNGKEMSHFYFLNEDHTYKPCSFQEWGQQVQRLTEQNKKHVAYDVINGYRVSTIWLGIDHDWLNDGPPLLFETMIFLPNDQEEYCDRYTTWEQAVEGHQEAIHWVKNICKQVDK